MNVAPISASPASKTSKLWKFLIVAGVLVLSHLVVATIGYNRLNGGIKPELTVDSPLDDWIQATRSMDVSNYMEAAQNLANGKKLVTLGAGRSKKDRSVCVLGPRHSVRLWQVAQMDRRVHALVVF